MVGWGSNNITATFYFDGTQNFGAVGLHLSDAHGQAGIGLPLTVTINAGSAQVFTPVTQTGDNGNYWNWFDLARGTSGSSISARLDRNDALGPWMFMDEVSLLSAAEVSGAPEPGTPALVASGLGLAAFLKRRRAQAGGRPDLGTHRAWALMASYGGSSDSPAESHFQTGFFSRLLLREASSCSLWLWLWSSDSRVSFSVRRHSNCAAPLSMHASPFVSRR